MLSLKISDCFAPAALLLFVCVQPAMGETQVYVCTDAHGTRIYQNTGQTDQCRKLNLEPVLTVPAPVSSGQGKPPVSPSRSSSAGGGTQAASVQHSDTGSSDRDVDRRKILEQELLQEEARLLEIRQRNPSATDARLQGEISRSEASIVSLKREISKLKRP